MSGKKWLLIGAALALPGGIILWRTLHVEPLEVWAVSAAMGEVEASVSNTRAGTVKACRRSRLSMPIGGVVDRLLVDEGQSVEKGQLLLELWNQDRMADVHQAEGQLAAARHAQESACLEAQLRAREASRIKSLVERRLASDEAVDSAVTLAETQQRACEGAKHQTAVAKARLQYQQALLERTQLRAPFAGVVAEINGEAGEYITPSPPGIPTPAAIDLIDYSCLYVTAPIDEIDASRLRVGMPARVELDAYRGQSFPGRLTRIAPYVLDLEKQARTIDIDVQFDHIPDAVSLLVGYSANVTVILDRHSAVLRVPTEAILQDGTVWVVNNNNKLERRTVTAGLGNWSYTEVQQGLEAGEQVLTSPEKDGVEEGAAVIVVDD